MAVILCHFFIGSLLIVNSIIDGENKLDQLIR